MRMMKHKIIIIPHQDSNSGPNHLSLLEFKMGHRPLSHHDPICLNFFDFSSFFTKTMKKLILTSIWQHPNAGRNIQKLVLCYDRQRYFKITFFGPLHVLVLWCVMLFYAWVVNDNKTKMHDDTKVCMV